MKLPARVRRKGPPEGKIARFPTRVRVHPGRGVLAWRAARADRMESSGRRLAITGRTHDSLLPP
jgi:hypothetical protein